MDQKNPKNSKNPYTYYPLAEQRKFRPIVWGLLKGILCRQSLSQVEGDEAGKERRNTVKVIHNILSQKNSWKALDVTGGERLWRWCLPETNPGAASQWIKDQLHDNSHGDFTAICGYGYYNHRSNLKKRSLNPLSRSLIGQVPPVQDLMLQFRALKTWIQFCCVISILIPRESSLSTLPYRSRDVVFVLFN